MSIIKSKISETNNFAFNYPELLKEWNFERNYQDPFKISPHSGKRVWWKCKNGHEWEQTINGRTKGFGCPCCSHRKPCKENNLSLYPVSKEFHLTKNGELKIEEIMPFSNKKVWWTCPVGHEYLATPSDRIKHSSGCPICHKPFSELEIRIASEAEIFFGTVIWGEKVNGKEIDVFLKDKSIGVEIDGYFWHKGKEDKDKQKNIFFENHGIKIIRVREKPLNAISDDDIFYDANMTEFSIVKSVIFKIANLCRIEDLGDYDSFVNDDRFKKILSFASFPKQSAKDVNPELENEWHKTKNDSLSLCNFSFGSQKKVWWICKNGHEFQSSIASRVKGHGCKTCHFEKGVSKETREKMSKSRIGHKMDNSTRDKFKEKRWSEENRKKLKGRKRKNGKFI